MVIKLAQNFSACLTAFANSKLFYSFVLSEDDPNYESYAGMEDEPNQQIHYYVRLSQEVKANESRTLYVDFSHMTSYPWEDPCFMDRLAEEYVRFEPYLR